MDFDKTFSKIEPSAKRGLERIYNEYVEGRKKFGKFKSEYEAYGVILEELNEFWHLVQNHDKEWAGPDNMKSEIQAVGAMAVAYLVEIANMEIEIALTGVYRKYDFKRDKKEKFNSPHEAYAMILEQTDKFWHMVKWEVDTKTDSIPKINRMIEIGALTMKFIIEM